MLSVVGALSVCNRFGKWNSHKVSHVRIYYADFCYLENNRLDYYKRKVFQNVEKIRVITFLKVFVWKLYLNILAC